MRSTFEAFSSLYTLVLNLNSFHFFNDLYGEDSWQEIYEVNTHCNQFLSCHVLKSSITLKGIKEQGI